MADQPENPLVFLTMLKHGDKALSEGGITLRDLVSAAAMANPNICTGTAPGYKLQQWFGRDATGITSAQIAARQALDVADAMLRERGK